MRALTRADIVDREGGKASCCDVLSVGISPTGEGAEVPVGVVVGAAVNEKLDGGAILPLRRRGAQLTDYCVVRRQPLSECHGDRVLRAGGLTVVGACDCRAEGEQEYGDKQAEGKQRTTTRIFTERISNRHAIFIAEWA